MVVRNLTAVSHLQAGNPERNSRCTRRTAPPQDSGEGVRLETGKNGGVVSSFTNNIFLKLEKVDNLNNI
ncbi:hypothetical protein TNCV_393231 [Trichonephila clavipes]|nr:hypothetical protein TNCV_393231 [Trichonephila clavipes]